MFYVILLFKIEADEIKLRETIESHASLCSLLRHEKFYQVILSARPFKARGSTTRQPA